MCRYARPGESRPGSDAFIRELPVDGYDLLGNNDLPKPVPAAGSFQAANAARHLPEIRPALEAMTGSNVPRSRRRIRSPGTDD